MPMLCVKALKYVSSVEINPIVFEILEAKIGFYIKQLVLS